MSIIKKIKVGIRNSSLSIAQTNEFIEFFCSQYESFNLDSFILLPAKNGAVTHILDKRTKIAICYPIYYPQLYWI